MTTGAWTSPVGSTAVCWPESHAVTCHIPDESLCEVPGVQQKNVTAAMCSGEGRKEERREGAVHTSILQTLCNDKDVAKNTDSTWEMPPPMQPPLQSSESRNNPFSFYSSLE